MRPITDPDLIAGYLSDASNMHGSAEALVRPESVAEVAEVLAHCQAEGIPVTVTARRTSTTGGPVPRGGWLLSTERLDAIIEIDERSATAQAGILLGELQDTLERQGKLFPPDPTSRYDCSLGGAIACNASGARSFKYGPTRPWIEHVEAVLPTGDVVLADRSTPIPEDWPRLRWSEPGVKTAAGFFPADNLLDLLIGSEGTLGLITRATIRLIPTPAHVFSVLAWFPDTAGGLAFVAALKASPTVRPRCIEWYDRHSLALVRERVPEIPRGARVAVWCEQEAVDPDPLVEAWLELIEAHTPLAEDTLFADDEASLRRLQEIRHAVPAGVNEAVVRNGMPKVATDFAVPDAAFAEMVAAYEAVAMDHVLFGHAGDNHLHLNLLPRTVSELDEAWAIWRSLYRLALSHGGTLSAEHGVGKLKARYLKEMVGAPTISTFRALKAHVDPAWIMGRGNLIDPEV